MQLNVSDKDSHSLSASGDTLLSATGSAWALTLQLFSIAGSLSFPLFILTRNSAAGKYSEIYYFRETAETAFFRWLSRCEKGELC